jgi:hypothetical protein
MRYFAVTDGDTFPVERPLSLVRQPQPGVLEYFGRDGNWWPDTRVGLITGESEHDLVEFTADQAERLQRRWTGETSPTA